jgi:hypothetical protein
MDTYRAQYGHMERVELYRRIADDVRGLILKMRQADGLSPGTQE